MIDSNVQEQVLAAISDRDEDVVGAILQDLLASPCTSTIVTQADSNGYTLLHHAVRKTDSISVLKLLANPTSLNAQNMWKRTALHQACGFGRPASVIRFLVQHGTQALDQPDEWGLVPLHYACWKGMDADLLKFMMESSPSSIRTVSLEGETPLYSACECERANAVPYDIYFQLATAWPVACGIVYAEAEEGRQCLAFQRAKNHGQLHDVVALLEATARDVVSALVECACHESTNVPSSIRADLERLAVEAQQHKRKVGSSVTAAGNSDKALTSAKISQFSNIPTKQVEIILHQPSIQVLLRDPSYQSHLCGLIRMNAAGRNQVTSKRDVLRVMDQVLDNAGCLYVLLREWPCMFCA